MTTTVQILTPFVSQPRLSFLGLRGFVPLILSFTLPFVQYLGIAHKKTICIYKLFTQLLSLEFFDFDGLSNER